MEADKPDYQLEKIKTATDKVKICDDFYVGATRVLNETYLPIWTGETEAGYATRLNSTAFANLYAPIIDGLTGLITKKEPTQTGYDKLDLEDIDMNGNSLLTFSKKAVKQSLIDGIVFISAETSLEHNRIYLKLYKYADLMSYRKKERKLTQIVFKEVVETEDGLFGIKKLERYKVFKQGGGEVWYASDGTDDIKLQETWENDLQELPIVALVTGKELSDFEIIPKFYDIAVLNRVHLNLESNIANVLSVVGNPIPIFYGDVGDGNVTIGVKDALIFADKQKEGFEYAEITGAGVQKLQDKIKSVEEQIDKLTFSLLKKQESKTRIDAQDAQSKNSSFLSDVAIELEVKMNKILKAMAELSNETIPQDAHIEYKKDFDTALISIEVAEKLLLAGEMSRETFYNILKTGELPKDFDVTEEAERIEKDTGMGIEND